MRREIEALAETFDQYRAHYGEDSDASRSARWLDENLSTSRLRVFVAEDNGRFVGLAITVEVPASLAARPLLAPRIGLFELLPDIWCATSE
jgi:hypothetical protein